MLDGCNQRVVINSVRVILDTSTDWEKNIIESSSAEKDSEVLVVEKINVGQRYPSQKRSDQQGEERDCPSLLCPT